MKRGLGYSKIILLIITIISLSLVANIVNASSISNGKVYHLKLLAVREESNGTYTGSPADLMLEIKSGHGRVFLDTYPLTKMDTQISTRFAKEIACKQFDLDCENYDFIYTIKSESSIVGGPSAGAAISALTTIAVLDLEYNQDIAITGTINSGGIVGKVGGVKEKLEAASKVGLKKVLISKGSAVQKTLEKKEEPTEIVTNKTIEINQSKEEEEEEEYQKINLIDYGKNNLSLEVKEVMGIDEVIFELTGKQLNHKEVNVNENEEYKKIMKGLQEALCERTDKIKEKIIEDQIVIDENILNASKKKEDNSKEAIYNEDYYSAASFCFGNNIILKESYYIQKNFSINVLEQLFQKLEQKNKDLKNKIDEKEITTISDLQASMVVKERINDVDIYIKNFNKSKDDETISNKELSSLLAYAEERYFSALSWMQFFSMDGKEFLMNDEILRNSCLTKISEAEERYQYASIYLGQLTIFNIKDRIKVAKESEEKGDYDLCLIKAAQAKADANTILSSLGQDDDSLSEFIESKSSAVERVISDNSAEEIFPIMGYSYYQYAHSLKEQDKIASLLYLEYALELSDLSMYFPEKESSLTKINNFKLEEKWIIFTKGFISGGAFTLLLFLIKYIIGKKKVEKEMKHHKPKDYDFPKKKNKVDWNF